MTSAKVLQLVRMLTHCDFEDELLLMWLSNCENTILTEIHLLSKEECIPIEEVSEGALTVPHPYDKLYLPYMQAQIHHAFGETDKYENFMALYNAYRDEYARKVLSEMEPAYGEAIAKGYYLTAYGIAKAHGYLGSEEEWLRSLQGTSPKITIGEVRSGNVGEAAGATMTGTDTDPVLNLVLPKGEQGPAGAAELPIAVGNLEEGIYDAFADDLPYVKPGRNGTCIGKGRQIIFVPKDDSPAGASLQINGGDTVEIRMRSSGDQLTEALPEGALRIGVPYTMTFCGMYWLVDSCLGGMSGGQEPGLAFNGGFVDEEGYLHLTLGGAEVEGFSPVYIGDRSGGADDLLLEEERLYLMKDGEPVGEGVTLPQGSAFYIGSGEMPKGCNVQIDLEGEVLDLASLMTEDDFEQAIEDALEDLGPPESGGGITEERVIQMIDEAFGGLLDGKY